MPPTFLQFEQLKLVTEFINGGYKHKIAEEPLRFETWTRAGMLGEGTFGKVYKETCAETRNIRAVKQIKKSFARPNELAILAQLRSYPEHFVCLVGWFEDENNIYLAMEYLPGDLDALLREQDLSEDSTKRVTKQVLAGLEIMHREDICHRDLKPSNILIAKWIPISVKIADFGVSKHFDGTEGRTETGTRPFMAPEVWGFGESSVYTTAIDMWSLGCLVYFMMTRRTPFPEPRGLLDFMQGQGTLPQSSAIPRSALDFIASLLLPLPEARAPASKAQLHFWLEIKEQHETLWAPLSPNLHHEQALTAGPELIIGAGKDPVLGSKRKLALPPPAPKKQPRLSAPHKREMIQDAFFAAAASGNCELLTALLERGADIGASDSKDMNALYLALDAGNLEAVKLLLDRGASISGNFGPQGWTILNTAVWHGHFDVALSLLDRGADIHGLITVTGSSSLKLAAQQNHPKLVSLLLDRGADISHKSLAGFGAVHVAAQFGSIESLRMLRDRGADMSEQAGPYNMTPLHIAAEFNQTGVMEFLLDTGVDIAAKSAGGWGALHFAACWGRLGAARLLLERGVSTTTRSKNEDTAISLAVSEGHTDVVLLIVDWAIKDTTIPSTALNNLKLSTDRMQDSTQTSSGDESTTS